MHCPDYNIFRTKFISLTMHSDRDLPRKHLPKTQWINVFRYEVIFFPKGFNQNARMIIINKHGMANVAVSNFIYRIKVKLGLRKPLS